MSKERNIMVCVTNQKTCSRLIYKGDEVRNKNTDKLYIVHIINKKDRVLYGDNDGDALEYLFDLAKNLNAELIVQRSSNTEKSIIKVAKEIEATHIILGKSNNENNQSFHKKISRKLKDINIVVE
ncbi:MAG: universal stress protein UspA [Bacillota bacterium]|nr:universal stress protein UspA [Bacillota bacterium]